jgi:PAS domain S-box-containing protein
MLRHPSQEVPVTDGERELDRNWLFRNIVECAGDAVLFADLGGRIRYWNAGAAAMFGWSAAEALGQSMDLIIPERQRGRHWHGWEQVMKSGHTRYGKDILAVPASRKDGAPLSIEFTIQLLRDDAGAVAGASAIIRDVTVRWTRDRELRKRLAALEARLGEAPTKGG